VWCNREKLIPRDVIARGYRRKRNGLQIKYGILEEEVPIMLPNDIRHADSVLEAEAKKWLASWRDSQTDDDVWAMCYIQAKTSGGLDDSVQQKWLQMGLAEIARRSHDRLRTSIDAFSASSDEYSKKIVRLTLVLIVLTFVLAVLAIPPAIEAIFK
jgi:hypothetical protein